MTNASLYARLLCLSLSLAACGDSTADSTDTNSAQDGEDASTGSPAATVKKDAGGSSTIKLDGGSSSTSTTKSDAGATATRSDAGSPSTTTVKQAGVDAAVSNPLDGLGGLLGGVGGATADAGKPPMSTTDTGSMPDKCANAVCFDVGDCVIWHTDILDCGFTACVGFVCQ